MTIPKWKLNRFPRQSEEKNDRRIFCPERTRTARREKLGDDDYGIIGSVSFSPKLLEYHRAGDFPFEKMLHFYRYDDIEKAFDASRSCSVIKPVVLLEE